MLSFQVAEEVLSRLKDPSDLESYLIQLGKIHFSAGISKDHLEIMGTVFCRAVRPVLEVSHFEIGSEFERGK